MTKPKQAIYPGTFDPMTKGHLNVVHRASRLFDHVTVAVADNVNKSVFLPHAERVALAEEVLKDYPNVKVIGFKCLLTALTDQLGINVVIRGVRAVSDFDYEFQLAMMNRSTKADFETIFLTPSEEYMFVSSSLVREIANYRGDISGFVPGPINAAIRKKLNY